MTEKMMKRLDDLRARQATGEQLRCPRCGRDAMKPDLHTNALSRHAEGIYVCDSCGTAEAMLDFMHQELPVMMWAEFRPQREGGGFESVTAIEAMAKIMSEQLETLTEIFRKCIDHPENRDEYRAEAYEKCPGLSELWTDSFAARYDTGDRPVMLRFRMTENGEVEAALNILEDK